jgi:murein L,D-transpeptidase YcbB/YkuD
VNGDGCGMQPLKHNKFRQLCAGATLFTCLVHPLRAQTPPPAAAASVPDSVHFDVADSAAMRALVSSMRNPAMQFDSLRDVATELRRVYDSSAWRPRWIAISRGTDSTVTYKPSQAAVELVAAINLAYRRGLAASDYDVAKLPALMMALNTPQARAQYDIALSANALRLTRALHEGRIKPSDAHAELRIPRPRYDAAAVVRAMSDSSGIEARLDTEEPPFLHYQLLKKALAKYRAMRIDSTLLSLPKLADGKVIKPGGRYAGIGKLRALLTNVGDLPLAQYAPNPDSTRLLGDVLEGLKSFQRRTGLESQGNFGPQTMNALKQPFDARVRTIELSLERWRWLPRTYVAPPILVNLPAFRLYAFKSNSDDEKDLLEMDVAIGESFDKKTPIFSDTLRTIVFSPYWDVPISISKSEIIPKARKDIKYLEKSGYEIVKGDADNSPVLPNDKASLDLVAKEIARIRQVPGPTNSLGRVKFLFPNSYNIYFHDTPTKSVFNKSRRDVSHGCIRLSKPAELAALLLADKPAWTREAIDSAMKQTTPERVQVKVPRPVFILYSTAMATQDGQTYFYPDIYGYDKELAALLQKNYPYAH